MGLVLSFVIEIIQWRRATRSKYVNIRWSVKIRVADDPTWVGSRRPDEKTNVKPRKITLEDNLKIMKASLKAVMSLFVFLNSKAKSCYLDEYHSKVGHLSRGFGTKRSCRCSAWLSPLSGTRPWNTGGGGAIYGTGTNDSRTRKRELVEIVKLKTHSKDFLAT